MSSVVAQFDPSTNTNAQFTAPASAANGALVFFNESPNSLTLTFADKSDMYLPAWYHRAKCGATGSVNIAWDIHTTLSSGSPPMSMLIVEAFAQGEAHPADGPLVRQTNGDVSTTTQNAGTLPVFGATFGVGVSAGTLQSLNVFNPANSGVNLKFYAARFFTTASHVGDIGFISAISGADLNLPNAIPIISHDFSASPPTSAAHATAQDDSSGHGGTQLEVYDSQSGVTLDFLAFPDQIILRPGNNLRVGVQTSGAAGIVARLTLKWTEVPLTPQAAATGGGTGGNILIASTLVNNGNSVGTGIISAQPSGDTQNAIFADNIGNLTLGDLLHSGKLTVTNGVLTLTLDNTNGLIGGGKGKLHLGQVVSGDTFDTDLNGNTYFKSAASSNQNINFQPDGSTIMCYFTPSGIIISNGGIQFVGNGVINRVNSFVAAVTTTPTLFSHGLGAIPNRIMFAIQGTSATAASVQYDTATLSSSQIKLTGSGSFNVLVTVFS